MELIDRFYSSRTGKAWYSVRMSESELRLFSSQHTTSLEDYNSNRGLGRSLVIGGLGGNALGAAAGGYVGKIAAEDADRAGLSDKQIIKKASTAGAITGAATGLVRGAISKSPGSMVVGSVTGGLGGFMGANKNTRSRLKKRNKKERM